MRLVDAHGHLQHESYAGDRDAVIEAAAGSGVVRLLVPGWDAPSSRDALELAARYPWVDAAVGTHPHDASSVDDDAWSEVARLATDERVRAIGETGLDYDRAYAPREDQLANLRRNLALALDVGKPAILHCRSKAGQRDAQDELLDELRRAGLGGPAWRTRFGDRPPAVLHSFSGPPDYAAAALDLGLMVSFGGLVFRRGEEASGEIARMAPDDRLLVETDCPFLSPPGAPRRRNEPRWVEVTARWLAAQRADDPDALGERLVANYDRTFGR